MESTEGLALISYCPLCDARYTPTHVHLLGERGDTTVLHMTCNKCQNGILALVLANQVGVSSVGVVTDLTYKDALATQHARALTIDDVIDTHQWLTTPGWADNLPKTSDTSSS